VLAWEARGWIIKESTAVVLWVGSGLNLIGLLVFSFRRLRWSTSTIAAVQMGNILFSLAASVTLSPAWLLLGTAPALVTLILILALRRTDARSAASL
jgi:hypothetical protein